MFIQRLVAAPDSKLFFLSRPQRSEPYRADGRPIWLVGLTFESSPHRLADCAAARWNEDDI